MLSPKEIRRRKTVYEKQWRTNNPEKHKRQRSREYQYRKMNTPHVKWMFWGLKRSAKVRNIPFNITVEDIIIPERCPVLDIPLNQSPRFTKGKPMDDSPSVDRIDSTIGYTKENIIVVSFRVNRIKSNATIEELEKMAAFYRNLITQRQNSIQNVLPS